MTMLPLAVLAAFAQTPVGPVLPAGASEPMLRLFSSVQERVANSDWTGALRLAAMLPNKSVTVEWDDTKVPAARRAEFAAARDKALAGWQMFASDYSWRIGRPGDIKVTFVPSLPPNADTPLPAGAVFFFSEDPSTPRVEAVISLRRGEPQEPAEAADVHNEVAFALASYFGLARTIAYDTYSYRTELPNRNFHQARPQELFIARRILEACDSLREAIKSKRRIRAAKPQLFIEPTHVDGGSHIQGDEPTFTLQFTNLGNATLNVRTLPDCGCLLPTSPTRIEPGATAIVKLVVDTTEFVGHLKKKLVVYSNDPGDPVRTIPVELFAKPLYRFLTPQGNTVVVGAEGGRFEGFLVFDENLPLVPVEVQIDGVSGSVAYGPWEGNLPDPEFDEPAKRRKGYRFTVTYGPDVPPGRMFSTLTVVTNSPDVLKRNADKFRVLRQPITVQKGIIAIPEQLMIGEIARAPKRAFFLVSRPGKPFRILTIESASPFLTFSHAPVREQWEHRITVEYDGKSEIGLLQTEIVVRTDDPSQPEIRVPFRAIVR